MDTCICIAESPCLSSETITLLIIYAPKQNKSLKKRDTLSIHFTVYDRNNQQRKPLHVEARMHHPHTRNDEDFTLNTEHVGISQRRTFGTGS